MSRGRGFRNFIITNEQPGILYVDINHGRREIAEVVSQALLSQVENEGDGGNHVAENSSPPKTTGREEVAETSGENWRDPEASIHSEGSDSDDSRKTESSILSSGNSPKLVIDTSSENLSSAEERARLGETSGEEQGSDLEQELISTDEEALGRIKRVYLTRDTMNADTEEEDENSVEMIPGVSKQQVQIGVIGGVSQENVKPEGIAGVSHQQAKLKIATVPSPQHVEAGIVEDVSLQRAEPEKGSKDIPQSTSEVATGMKPEVTVPSVSSLPPSSPILILPSNHKKFQYKIWTDKPTAENDSSKTIQNVDNLQASAKNIPGVSETAPPVMKPALPVLKTASQVSSIAVKHEHPQKSSQVMSPMSSSQYEDLSSDDDEPVAAKAPAFVNRGGKTVDDLILSPYITREQAQQRMDVLGFEGAQREINNFSAIIFHGNAFRRSQ